MIYFFIFIIYVLFYNNTKTFHYVEYYGLENNSFFHIKLLEQTKIKMKEYYQKKLLGKRITQNELEKLFQLMEEIYFYIKEIILKKKNFNETPKIIVHILNIIITYFNNYNQN